MTAYRLRCLDAVGRTARTEAMEASSDGEAIQLARTRMVDTAQCELWRKDRLIARIDTRASLKSK